MNYVQVSVKQLKNQNDPVKKISLSHKLGCSQPPKTRKMTQKQKCVFSDKTKIMLFGNNKFCLEEPKWEF